MNDDEDVIGVDMGPAAETHSARELALANENARLRGQLEAIRKVFRPLWSALKSIMSDDVASTFNPLVPPLVLSVPVAGAAYAPWVAAAKEKTARGRMLLALIDRPCLSRAQLSTFSGISIRSSSFRNGLSWMRRNHLVTVAGESVALQEPPA